jgi:hypothetical protein
LCPHKTNGNQQNLPQNSSQIFNKFLYLPGGEKGKGMGREWVGRDGSIGEESKGEMRRMELGKQEGSKVK